MRQKEFFKLQGSGNDFILIENAKRRLTTRRLAQLARRVCKRKISIGADGLLVIEPTKKALFTMRIFNPDGSEVEMCGNGSRCAALWAKKRYSLRSGKEFEFKTKAGIIRARVKPDASAKAQSAQVAIAMANPVITRLLLPLRILRKSIKVNVINTGVPHAVLFVQGLDAIDVEGLGSQIRHHKAFKPAGTNVDFVEFKKSTHIRLRTYERGVEAETLACGTGAVAAAIIAWLMQAGSLKPGKKLMRVEFKSRQIVRVHFTLKNETVENVWFEGKTHQVYKGQMKI